MRWTCSVPSSMSVGITMATCRATPGGAVGSSSVTATPMSGTSSVASSAAASSTMATSSTTSCSTVGSSSTTLASRCWACSVASGTSVSSATLTPRSEGRSVASCAAVSSSAAVSSASEASNVWGFPCFPLPSPLPPHFNWRVGRPLHPGAVGGPLAARSCEPLP